MLRGMRKASSNWLGKTIMAVVMGVLIVSFGIWGIADIFRGFGQSTLARIGHTEISTEQFRQIYTERLQQIGRQFGRPMTMDHERPEFQGRLRRVRSGAFSGDHSPGRLHRATLCRRPAQGLAAPPDRQHDHGGPRAAENPDRGGGPVSERAALDRLYQARCRA